MQEEAADLGPDDSEIEDLRRQLSASQRRADDLADAVEELTKYLTTTSAFDRVQDTNSIPMPILQIIQNLHAALLRKESSVPLPPAQADLADLQAENDRMYQLLRTSSYQKQTAELETARSRIEDLESLVADQRTVIGELETDAEEFYAIAKKAQSKPLASSSRSKRSRSPEVRHKREPSHATSAIDRRKSDVREADVSSHQKKPSTSKRSRSPEALDRIKRKRSRSPSGPKPSASTKPAAEDQKTASEAVKSEANGTDEPASRARHGSMWAAEIAAREKDRERMKASRAAREAAPAPKEERRPARRDERDADRSTRHRSRSPADRDRRAGGSTLLRDDREERGNASTAKSLSIRGKAQSSDKDRDRRR